MTELSVSDSASSDGSDRVAVDVSLAEFAALRQEIQNRSGAQHVLLNLNITAVATIIGLIASGKTNEGFLLLVVFVSPLLGMLWADHAGTIAALGRYIEHDLRPRVEAIGGAPLLAWEERSGYWGRETRSRIHLRFRLPYLLVFGAAPIASLMFTAARHTSVAGSVVLFWLLWSLGTALTAFMVAIIVGVEFGATLREKGPLFTLFGTKRG